MYEDLIMDKIDDLSNIEHSTINDSADPVTMSEHSNEIEIIQPEEESEDDAERSDYETLDIKDPIVWLFLDGGETQGLMNADFLEFFTI